MAEVMDLTLGDSDDDSDEVMATKTEPGAAAVEQLQQEILEVETQLAEVESSIGRLLTKQSALRAKKQKLALLLQAEQTAPRKDWAATGFPWDAQALDILNTTFKLGKFRPLQREVINATLQGRDVLCLLPSGGGKSLCYQLPALIDRTQAGQAQVKHLTLVVSPLLSLIQDQVAALASLGIPAAALTSLSSKEETSALMNRLAPTRSATTSKSKGGGSSSEGASGADPLPALLYVTPERVVSSKRLMSKMEKLYEAGQLSRIAVDEAHCCSQWGNDFRPDYKKLGILRTMFPKVPIIALTATATHQVRDDILNILNTPGAELFAASINRPNLHYEVALKPSTPQAASEALVSWISTNYPAGESGIVYALTRKECESLCEELLQAGVMAVHYHGDMEPAARHQAHMAWSAGRVQVVVATIAFGMGINKADVRFVVHASLSKSVENYYQESGRAGRDGLPARCLLYYRMSDALRQAGIVCYEPSWWSHLQHMMQYGSGVGRCRRAVLQAHFSEAPAECHCMCDTCMHAAAPPGTKGKGPVQVDVREEVGCVLNVLPTLPHGKATLIQLLEAWRKVDKQAVKKLGKDGQEQVIQDMLLKGHLQLDFGATAYATNVYLRVSERGLSLADRPAFSQPYLVTLMPDNEGGHAGPSAGADDSDDSDEETLGSRQAVTELKRWRRQQADKSKVFPDSVMCEKGVAKLARLVGSKGKDITLQEIKQVLGPIRGSNHGAALLQLLQGARPAGPSSSAQQRGAKEQAQGPSQKKPRTDLT